MSDMVDGVSMSLVEDLVEALCFYADTDTYFAIMFIPEHPAGAFVEDFDENHGDGFYKRAMPGSKARAVLKKHYDEIMDILPDE